MYCKYCGKENDDDAIFCTACGKKVHEKIEAAKADDVQDDMSKQTIAMYLRYFEEVIALEQRRLYLEELITRSEFILSAKQRHIDEINRKHVEHKHDNRIPKKSEATSDDKCSDMILKGFGLLLPAIVTVVFTLIRGSLADTHDNPGVFDIIMFLVFFIVGIPCAVKGIKLLVSIPSIIKSDKEAAAEIERYNAEIERNNAMYEEEFRQAYEKLQEEKTAEKAPIEKDVECIKQNIEFFKNTYEETKDTLEKYYEIGYLYPSYRNYTAVIYMHQYLDSGRFKKLTGPDGAYNQYGIEQRLDDIKESLENILSQVKSIVDYCRGIAANTASINRNIISISGKIDRVSTDLIAQTEMLSAYQNKIEAGQYDLVTAINNNTSMVEDFKSMQDIQNKQELALAEYRNFALKQKRLEEGFYY